MSTRKKNAGLALMRRSTDQQEMSLELQLTWARNAAKQHGITLDASLADLRDMQSKGLCEHKSMFIDDAITGADLGRPGLRAFKHRVMDDASISHVFVYRADRLARPEDPLDGMRLELDLRTAGITLVFSNRVGLPRQRGANDIADNVQLMFEYTEAGQYLQTLAQRTIDGQIQCAKRGGWTGGRAPFGFVRILVNANGEEVQELADGMRVRKPGCLTKIRPKDVEKIKIWLLILQWYAVEQIGATKIAQRLNGMNIPSPDAGRLRTDHGCRHKVTGKWCSGTVLSLIRNKAIIGINTYGVQSEGKYRRLGISGARILSDSDRRNDSKVRVIKNPESIVLENASGFPSQADKNVFDVCQSQLRNRGQNQRGISRRRNPSLYPLATRVWDMSDGCGHMMYAKQSGDRVLYLCGRYMRTAGAECNHNGVDGEAALKFVLGFLRQQTERLGGRNALRQALLKRASEAKPVHVELEAERETQRMRKELVNAEAELTLIGRNLARAKDDAESDFIRTEWKAQQELVARIQKQIRQLAQQKRPASDPMDRVEAAMSLYDDITTIVDDSSTREKLPALLAALNMRLWLNFGSALKGSRPVRVLLGGIVTTGAAQPPIRPYGKDRNGFANDHDLAGLSPVAVGNNEMPSVDFVSQSEGVSLTMVNRGDKI